jgi:GalNAc-alpha-(1->4)-GalNAc-alpha-(1->3)-diNAcBac-PP-undecaprenol alpha-1,4-N-acetyl-D-galactosaminyltransferase
MEREKVCFILSGLQGGGTEKVVVTLAEKFSDLNIEVSIITLFLNKRSLPLSDRIKIFEPGVKRKNWNKYLYAILIIPYLRRTLKHINPDVIVSNGEWFNPFVILATRLLRFRLFVTDHMHPDLHFGFVQDVAKRILYKRATGVIVQTNYAAQVIKTRVSAKNVFVIPNPVTPIARIQSEQQKSIISVGRLSKEKGHEILIKAFSGLKKKDWRLNIVGDGPLADELKKLTYDLGLSDKVIFHGFLSDITSILSASKIFVLPSLSENFPLALCEAMTVPLPCISSDCLAGSDKDAIIKHGENGLLVKPGDIDDLTEKTDLLIEDELLQKKLAINAYKSREKFDLDHITVKYLSTILGRGEKTDHGVREIKSVCFIGAGLQGGGMERSLSTLANYFSSKGMIINVILLFKREHFFKLNKDIIIKEPSFSREKYSKYLYAAKITPYLRKNLKTFNPDIIISFGEWFNPFVILATRGLKYPVFVSDRMSPVLNLGSLNSMSKKLLYKFADGIIVQTNLAEQTVRQKTRATNITVIPNPVNIFDFPQLEKKNYIVTVGRLTIQKNQELLLRAFSKSTAKEWSLHIIGDGPKRKDLEILAEDLLISDRVFFHGYLTDFTRILAESRIFVLPSLSEGFPNALIEAMSVPLACISTNCKAGPFDIIVNGKNGLLVESSDITEMTNAIDILVNDQSLRKRLAKEAFEIRNKLNLNKIAARYLDFFSSSINN